mmetsp:Transcript_13737/g.40562  ORF Transcript_13737/g.40562 Transcript_13737/m.40562 type:complete len:206 (-) Transcript_13737:686-1303(-)
MGASSSCVTGSAGGNQLGAAGGGAASSCETGVTGGGPRPTSSTGSARWSSVTVRSPRPWGCSGSGAPVSIVTARGPRPAFSLPVAGASNASGTTSSSSISSTTSPRSSARISSPQGPGSGSFFSFSSQASSHAPSTSTLRTRHDSSSGRRFFASSAGVPCLLASSKIRADAARAVASGSAPASSISSSICRPVSTTRDMTVTGPA